MSCASEEMDINEKWLGEIGGWAAMKAARSIVAAGGVEGVSREGEWVRGRVGSGKTRFASGLRIRSRTDVENLCTCPTARRGGGICEHSIAVALALICPPSVAREESPKSVPLLPGQQRDTTFRKDERVAMNCPHGAFSIYLADDIFLVGSVRKPQVFLKFDPKAEGQDLSLYHWLSTRGLVCQSQPLSLEWEDFFSFLEALKGHKWVYRGRPATGIRGAGPVAIVVSEGAIRIPLRVKEIYADWFESEPVDPTIRPLSCPVSQLPWWYCESSQILFPQAPVDPEVTDYLKSVNTDKKGIRKDTSWLINKLDQLESACTLELIGNNLRSLKILPVPCAFELSINGNQDKVKVEILAKFERNRWVIGKNKIQNNNGQCFPIRSEKEPNVYYIRNNLLEKRAEDHLLSIGFQYLCPEGWILQGAEEVLSFYASGIKKLQENFVINEEESWRKLTRNWMRISPRTKEISYSANGTQSGQDWLSLDIAYESPSGFRIPRSDVLQMIRVGRRSGQDRAGRRFVIDVAACEELEESLQDVDVQLMGDGGRIRPEYAHALMERDEASSWLEETVVRSKLGETGVILRDYQVTGVRWMERLAREGRGALLADDMGLGKTLQTISLLRLLRESQPSGGPSLIVCPKSLIMNWQSELERFAPSLKVLVLVGERRQTQMARIHQFDVILTTYQLVVRDSADYGDLKFGVIALDEASYIRNSDTEASKAIRKLKAGCRIALTGTPIENGVRDLWSIFQFLMPGYLGAKDTFKERFEKSLSGDVLSSEAQSAVRRLKKLVNPYVLRRTKAEVLKELPEKIEQVIWCELSPPQNEIYRRILDEGVAEIRDARKRSGDSGARMTMFTVLLRLRQICCDLRMTGVKESALMGLSDDELSGKVSVWLDRVREIVNGRGKVLVFSQFVKFLQILRVKLEGESIRFAYLDGSTQDRGKVVQSFETDPDCRIFLISLKAGGYGLNLTSANHVILMDPWWNPAVEAQAIDRAHRMGQNRAVTAIRLVTKGTVEEKILKLQAKKRGVIEATLDEAGSIGTGLTDSELQSLIEP